jgi:hypothetical protein
VGRYERASVHCLVGGPIHACKGIKHSRALRPGNPNVLVCERGTMFGYSDLVVDPRNLVLMRDAGCPVTCDVTHALQQPAGRPLEVGTLPSFVDHVREDRPTRELPRRAAAWRAAACGSSSRP